MKSEWIFWVRYFSGVVSESVYSTRAQASIAQCRYEFWPEDDSVVWGIQEKVVLS